MKRLAELLAALAAAPHDAARAAWLDDYLAAAPDPDRGWAVGWLLGALKPPRLSPAKLRALTEAEVDPELLRLSTAALGDAAEAAALIWPGSGDAPPGEILAGLDDPGQALSRLDAEPRVALIRLMTGRRAKGARFAEIRDALARCAAAPADRVAAGLAAEAPPYPALFAWLRGEGPAPAPRAAPPDLSQIAADGPPPGAHEDYRIWPLPPGEPVAIAAGRAIAADGRDVAAPPGAGDAAWGFLGPNGFAPMPPEAAPLTLDWDAARRAAGALLLLRGEAWAIWPAPARRLICPVTFITLDRRIEITLGVTLGDDIAPLIKLPAPEEEASRIAAFARKMTVEKFGPVRQVSAGLWVDLSYAGWAPSPRRKTKIALSGAAITGLIWAGPHPTPALDEVLAAP